MANQAANHIKYLLATGAIDFSNDQFKIILMEDTFIFNKDDHEDYADVSAEELPDANGYNAGGEVLGSVAVTEDDTDDRCEVTWANASWTASGGSIGPTKGAIIYDVTAANAIVGYIDFGSAYTQIDGGVLTLANLEIRIK